MIMLLHLTRVDDVVEKKFTGNDQSSECYSPHRIYNSLLGMRAIHELKMNYQSNKDPEM